MRRSRVVACAVLSLFAAACGSTVQASRTTIDATGGDGGAGGLAGPPVAVASSGPDGAAPGTSTGTANAAAVGGSGSLAGGSSPTGAPGDAAPVQGVGVTATKIYVGLTYQTNGDAANQALGANSITQGDQKADEQAVVDDINAHGGVAGRKVVPVYYNYDVTDTRPYADQDNAACAKFTQDNHVFAVLGNGVSDNYVACNTKAGAIDLGSNIISPDKAFFRRFPAYIGYDTVSQDRMMADEVNVLVRMKYFTGWNNATGQPMSGAAKVGIIGYDTPAWTTPLRSVMLPALARAGHAPDPGDVQLILYPQDNSQVGPAVAEIQNAILRFRQDNVTHVIVLDANGSMMLQLMQNARGQHYYPRYGVNTATGMEALSTTGAVDDAQFNGAVGLGWSPTLDLPDGRADPYLGPATTACIKMIEKRTGQTFTSTNAASIALDACDGLYLLRRLADSAGPVLNQRTAVASVEALGASWRPAGLASAFFSPSQHDSLATGYDMLWDTSCSCSKYVGRHRIP
jgi:ABC-type branched-subunit amino acid transport system substrate-binding protein